MNQINKKRHFVIGTAGHIDHGKTSLVKNLTGTDTDWLREEKERGMTIDLGFAFLGDDVTIIDVPGHEKFVRNMVAGVSTIDLVLFVIAADDGVMPQTREHLDILKLLQIKQGILVITKIDLVERDWLELVIEEIKEFVKDTFLKDAPIVPISNQSGEGIETLKEIINAAVAGKEERQDKGVFRMPIDRVFTMKGFGTVVAGTVLSGTLKMDQMVELLPQNAKLRVRRLEIHENTVNQVKIGDRAAINLANIEKEAVTRGDVLAEPAMFQSTRFFDGKFYLLESASRNLKNTARIRLNIGTAEVIGRVSILDSEEVKRGESVYIQFRLESPIVADVGDRFVVRSYSPVYTIGGGVVLDVKPKRHKRFSEDVLKTINVLESGDPENIIDQNLLSNKFTAVTAKDLVQQSSLSAERVDVALESLCKTNRCYRYQEKGQTFFLHSTYHDRLSEKILNSLSEYHEKNPNRKGISRTDLKVLIDIPVDVLLFNKILDELVSGQKITIAENRVAAASHKLVVSEKQQKAMDRISAIYFEENFTTSSPAQIAEKTGLSKEDVSELVDILIETGMLRRVEEEIIFHSRRVMEGIQIIRKHFETNTQLTVGDFRQMLNSSRKYVVPLLNFYDAIGLTVRQQDVRAINPDFKG
ncbi:MAG: selenocysteine-specific translation elongation factor [Candidatus Zhuqueibacterota bacterium]